LLLLAACAAGYVFLKRKHRKASLAAVEAFSFGSLLDPAVDKPGGDVVKFKRQGNDEPFCEPTGIYGSDYGIKA
jgi:hypothetical protein